MKFSTLFLAGLAATPATILAQSTTSSYPIPSGVPKPCDPHHIRNSNSSLDFHEIFSGYGVYENPTNPGSPSGDYYQEYTYYGGDPAVDSCTEIAYCATLAPGGSFNAMYIISEGTWICNAFPGPNEDASYFDLPGSDTGYSFGYSTR